ncbi:ATP synthase protein I [Rhodospirillaceae bacterium LM-1]|nr:ATP synthase protein I [Rhodospirillaceae bacterium LM-1]
MGDDASSPTPKEIEARLRKMQAEGGQQGASSDKNGPDPSSMTAGLGVAMRIGVELVSALMVGVGIGFGLDTLFDTKPWLMLVFFFVGSAAGIMNVWRVVSGQGFTAGYRDRTGGDDRKDNAKR